MKNLKFSVCMLLAALAIPSLALAQEDTSGLAPALAEFVSAPGYEPADVERIEELVEALLPPSDSVFTAGSQMSPLAKAIQTAVAVDGELMRTRQHLSLAVIQLPEAPAADPVPFLLVQLDRFNLGPSIRAELVESIGEDHVAPVEEFGEGPHVSWRLIMRPLMGNQSLLVAASRLEISSEDAAALDCLGVDCLNLASGIEELADWNDLEDAELAPGLNPLAPEVMVDVLAELPFFDAYGHEAGFDATDQPITVAHVLLETNLGQDLATDGALRVGELRDDSLQAIWQRAVALDMGDSAMLLQSQTYECRRGVSDAGLCL